MRVLRGLLLAVWVPVLLHAQATIPVSGAKVKDNNLRPVTGQIVFTVTDATDTPVSYTEQGGGPSTAPFVVQVVNGAVQTSGGYPPQIANPATMSPANTRYRMQVESAGGAAIYFTFPLVQITQAYFSYDGYAVPAGVTASGAGIPHVPCAPKAQYQNTLTSDPYPWVCSQFQNDSSVYWTQNPSLSPACQRGNDQAVASSLTGSTFCVDAAQAFVTPGFVWAAPGQGGMASPIGLVPLSTLCAGGSCGGGTPGGGLHSIQINGIGSTAGSFAPSTFFTDATNSDLLAVRNLTGYNTNGRRDADLYGGAAAAVTACAGANCSVHISALSTDGESIFGLPTAAPFHLFDERKGVGTDLYVNPVQTLFNGNQPAFGYSTNCLWSVDGLSLPVERDCLRRNLVTGGSGMNSANTWQVDQLTNDTMTVLGGGIKQAYGLTLTSIRDGDLAGQYWYINFRDATWTSNDEGVKGSGVNMRQLPPPVGTVTSVSGTGNTVVTTSLANIGQGFMLVDENDVFSHGNIIATTPSPDGYALPSITTSDTHAVSTWQATLAASCGSFVTPNAPVTAKCGVTGATGTFNPALKVCVGDYTGPETSNIALDTDGVSYDIGMTRVHPAGVPLAQGGACGKVIVLGSGQSTLAALHNYPNFYTSYWEIASATSTTATYVVEDKEGQNGQLQISVPYVGVQANAPVTRDGSGNATLTPQAGSGALYPQPDFFDWNTYTAPPNAQITLSGCADASFNETVSSTSADQTGIHFPLTGAAGSTTGCTLAVSGLNNYWAVGGAMTTGLPNVTMDANGNANAHGTMQVMPNDVTWNAGDTVIQANGYSNSPAISYEGLSNDTPPIAGANLGKLVSLTGRGSSGEAFFTLQGDQTSRYFGMGPNGFIGPHTIMASGDTFQTMFNLTQPALGGQVFQLDCQRPAVGQPCKANGTGYDLFLLGGLVGNSIHFEPSIGQISIPGAFYGATITSPNFNLSDKNRTAAVAVPEFYGGGDSTAPYIAFGSGGYHDNSLATSSLGQYSPTIYAGATIPGPPALYFPYGGSTSYSYAVTATTQYGETLPVTETINNQPATMSSSVSGRIHSNYGLGGQGFNIYRTGGGPSVGLLCTVTNENPDCYETGQAANTARVPPTVDTSGEALVSGSPVCTLATGCGLPSGSCISDGSPVNCGPYTHGMIAIAPGTTSFVINSTGIKVGSEVYLQYDPSSAPLGVSCTSANLQVWISARSAGSLTVSSSAAPAAGTYGCFSFMIQN